MCAQKIAFQGSAGAYSDLACRAACPDFEPLPCETFQLAFEAVQGGKAARAMIPIDNTLAGRVADVHHLLPKSGLRILAEHFQPIQHSLMGVKGAKVSDIRHVHSHIHALPQCRKLIARLNAKPHVESDTAGAARVVAALNDKEHAAIASKLAAEIYGLDILEENVQDAESNTTRFVVFTKDTGSTPYDPSKQYITSFIFTVRNIPASLYKALGGFATNGINMLKLESYIDESFQAAQFYADVSGHMESESLKRALEELGFFARELTMLGSYEAHAFRQ